MKSIITAAALVALATSAHAFNKLDAGPEAAPVGGSDQHTFSGAHEDDIHGDGNNPDHMDMGGDDMNNYESDWNMEY